MPDPAAFQSSKLPPEELALARRLRSVRESYQLSQSELARESILSKSAIRHYEAGAAPLPFTAGNRICQRLNIHQLWMASAHLPRAPYVDLADLAAFGGDLEEANKLTFFEAYTGPLRGAVEVCEAARRERARDDQDWREHIIRCSESEIEALLSSAVSEMRLSEDPKTRSNYLEAAEQLVSELRRRTIPHKQVDETPQSEELTPVQISKQLKQKRKQLGLTQEGAAKKWGVPVKTLQRWEQGANKPHALALRQLEQILREPRQSSD